MITIGSLLSRSSRSNSSSKKKKKNKGGETKSLFFGGDSKSRSSRKPARFSLLSFLLSKLLYGLKTEDLAKNVSTATCEYVLPE